MTQLKPCPFCGGKAKIVTTSSHRYRYKVECQGCGAAVGGTVFQNDEFNAEQWNRREGQAAPAALPVPEGGDHGYPSQAYMDYLMLGASNMEIHDELLAVVERWKTGVASKGGGE